MKPSDLRKARLSSRTAGFTLTELLVVMVILGLLAAAITPQIMGRLDTSKVRAAKLQTETLAASLDLYKIDMGYYPSQQEGLVMLVQPPANSGNWDGPYVRSGASLVDPWGRDFIYLPDASSNAFQLVSYGADGKEGGEKHDADIVFPDFSGLRPG
ncbi:type II secretion system major pseudopilin GspG [Hyphomonas sp. KY3]|uniref:type II secretion system major pseudopilin GspG n=1 Tax=Hyphomonas sp. KY3 TaxID=2016196 RepID=UPI001A8C0552|nr:type II secretion system major pseudopilin GspG [Hyphomonas sp. KY3]QSR23089.1 type II secretion system protein GspG [Hyphomonas sp. KY3]